MPRISTAFIDTTGIIKSAGTLGSCQQLYCNETLADGSPIIENQYRCHRGRQPWSRYSEPGMTYEGRTQGKVTFATTQNGFLTIDQTENQNPGDVITITVHANDGYKLDRITVNGTALAAGVLTFTMPADGSPVTLGATFVPKSYTVTSSNENAAAGTFYTSPRYGDEGDSIIIHVTPTTAIP